MKLKRRRTGGEEEESSSQHPERVLYIQPEADEECGREISEIKRASERVNRFKQTTGSRE